TEAHDNPIISRQIVHYPFQECGFRKVIGLRDPYEFAARPFGALAPLREWAAAVGFGGHDLEQTTSLFGDSRQLPDAVVRRGIVQYDRLVDRIGLAEDGRQSC